MPSSRHFIVLVVTALLAGCGAQAQERTRPAEPVRNAQVAAAAKDCGVSPDVAPAGAIVPAELRPDPAQVAAASSTDFGYQARVIYARPLREVMTAIVKQATAAGHETTFREYEGFDGELTFQRGDTTTTMRLLGVRECPRVSQATITAVER